jgi:hypothetical protein
MADLPRNLVVRAHAPVRRTVLSILFSIIGLFALYVVYELGRYDAGYNRLAVSQERTELETRIADLERINRELRTKMAELDTIRIGRNQERAELARTIGDLQAQVARQQQDLAFYRGIVTQGTSTLGVKIHQLRISATEEPNRFRVRLTIMQSVRPDEPVVGAVTMRLEGDAQGSASSLDLATLTRGKQQELPFNFRFLENFDEQIAIPDGFRPEKLTVEVRSNRKGVTPLTQSYLWRVDAL